MTQPDDRRFLLALTPAQRGLLLHCVSDQMIRDDGIEVFVSVAPHDECTPSEMLKLLMDAPVVAADVVRALIQDRDGESS